MRRLWQHSRTAALAGFLAVFMLILPGTDAEARGGYAKWLKHGDVYRVTGTFGGEKRSFRISLRWRGNRFTVSTPLGTFKLKPKGNSVTFRVLFQEKWASVRWNRNRATVIYNRQKGTAVVRKLENRSKTDIVKSNLK